VETGKDCVGDVQVMVTSLPVASARTSVGASSVRVAAAPAPTAPAVQKAQAVEGTAMMAARRATRREVLRMDR
jgi:hypothetical protein